RAARRGGGSRATRAAGVGRLQRPRPREPLPPALRRRHRRAAQRDRRRLRLPRGWRQLLHGRDASLAPAPARGGRPRARDDAGARLGREAVAPVPRPVARRRTRPGRDRRADAPARRHREWASRADAGSGASPGRRAHATARSAAASGARGPLDRRPMTRDLRPLFEPETLAIVGVSADPAKWGYWFARDA